MKVPPPKLIDQNTKNQPISENDGHSERSESSQTNPHPDIQSRTFFRFPSILHTIQSLSCSPIDKS